MTRYLLSVIHPPSGPPRVTAREVSIEETFAAVDEFNERLQAEGRWVFAGGLLPAHAARTARLDAAGTDAVVVDGPYLESEEHLGGFWIVEADEASIDEIARHAAIACRNDVEVRPFQSDAG